MRKNEDIFESFVELVFGELGKSDTDRAVSGLPDEELYGFTAAAGLPLGFSQMRQDAECQ